ncbi:PspC domain-containing protein [Paractinoplanes ovalisporus]|nr:PspC domain-containing protein [Actinoplanes ovalisporus]
MENKDLMNAVHDSMSRQGLTRPREGRLLAGVCAGLARRFGIDPWLARLLFVVILLAIPGSQILVYPILWIVMPSEKPAFVSAYPPAA